MIQRRIQATSPRKAPVSAVNATASQAGAPQASPARVHHEPRRRIQPVGYTNGTYFSRSRRSGFGSRQSMFRIT